MNNDPNQQSHALFFFHVRCPKSETRASTNVQIWMLSHRCVCVSVYWCHSAKICYSFEDINRILKFEQSGDKLLYTYDMRHTTYDIQRTKVNCEYHYFYINGYVLFVWAVACCRYLGIGNVYRVLCRVRRAQIYKFHFQWKFCTNVSHSRESFYFNFFFCGTFCILSPRKTGI